MTTETPPVSREWWRCQNCQRTLGEIVGTQIVIIIQRRHIFLSATGYAGQTCPHCGALNERQPRPSERESA